MIQKKTSLSTEFIKLNKQVDQSWKNFEKQFEEPHTEHNNKISKDHYDKKGELEDKISKLEKDFHKTLQKEKDLLEEARKDQTATNKQAEKRKADILRQYKLFAIKNDSDKKISWFDESDIKKAVYKEELNLAYCDIVTFITENGNKVNKFDLTVRVCPFSLIFKKMIEEEDKIVSWQRNLVNKAFPTINAAKEYIEVNRKKLIAPFGAYHDNIVDEIAKIDFSLYEEFDFRMLAYNYARREIVKLTSDTCVVEESDFGIHITISLNHSACKQEDNKLIFSVNVQKVKEGYDEKYVSGKELEERLNKKLSEVIKSILESSHPLFLNSSQYEVHFVEDKYKILAD